MEFISYTPLRYPYTSITWQNGSVCNYSCSYCLKSLHDGKIKFSDYKPFIKFLQKVKEKYKERPLVVTIFGGEVTTWPDIDNFLKTCKEEDFKIRLVSNGSKNVEWWKKHKDVIYHLVVSYHSEFASEKHITEVLKVFSQDGFCQLNMMLLPEKFDELMEMAERISKTAKVFVIPKLLRKDFSSIFYPYTEEQYRKYKKHIRGFGIEYLSVPKQRGIILKDTSGKIVQFHNAREIFLAGLNRWKGWKCSGGLETFFVDHDGSIYAGQCRVRKMGNVNTSFKLPDTPTICEAEVCKCTQDILETTKEKII